LASIADSYHSFTAGGASTRLVFLAEHIPGFDQSSFQRLIDFLGCIAEPLVNQLWIITWKLFQALSLLKGDKKTLVAENQIDKEVSIIRGHNVAAIIRSWDGAAEEGT
jgi:hypothetical protein